MEALASIRWLSGILLMILHWKNNGALRLRQRHWYYSCRRCGAQLNDTHNAPLIPPHENWRGAHTWRNLEQILRCRYPWL
jgi:hypothetical protein